jgi:hypothetical protein
MSYTPTTWVDEVLSGAERFDIKEDGGTPIHENVQIVLASTVTTPGTSLNATNMNHIEGGIADLDTLLASLYIAPTTFIPTWTGLTGTLDLGNTFNYTLIGKQYMISGYFGASGQIVSVYGTTFLTTPISVYLTCGINVYHYPGGDACPEIIGYGSWHGNRLWLPSFDLTNVYCDVISIGRKP